jgi:HTH-type transcriptional regulator/antitoxin HigA
MARRLGHSPKHVSDLYAGRRRITAPLAIKLERVLGHSAKEWLMLQMEWDLKMARERERERRVNKSVW